MIKRYTNICLLYFTSLSDSRQAVGPLQPDDFLNTHDIYQPAVMFGDKITLKFNNSWSWMLLPITV